MSFTYKLLKQAVQSRSFATEWDSDFLLCDSISSKRKKFFEYKSSAQISAFTAVIDLPCKLIPTGQHQ